MIRSASIATYIAATAVFLLISGCDPEAKQARGFSLPEGDAAQGKINFVTFRCNACHVIGNIPQDTSEFDHGITVKLGGKVASIRTYGDLLTSIINPSHRIAQSYRQEELTTNGKSKMLVYNDVMTVTELVDIVTFLQSEYELLPYPRTVYGPFYPVPL